MTMTWQAFASDYAKRNNITYKQALTACREDYYNQKKPAGVATKPASVNDARRHSPASKRVPKTAKPASVNDARRLSPVLTKADDIDEIPASVNDARRLPTKKQRKTKNSPVEI